MSDYIKREDAMAHPFANENYDHQNANMDFIFGLESYREWLETLPAADVRENVHGKWIQHEDDWYGDYWECSNCHNEYTIIEGDMYYDFCPGCGADMREEPKR